jgi:hypothetical protein
MSLFSGKNGVTMGTGNEFGTPVHLTNETILGGTMGKKNKISLIHWMHVPQIMVDVQGCFMGTIPTQLFLFPSRSISLRLSPSLSRQRCSLDPPNSSSQSHSGQTPATTVTTTTNSYLSSALLAPFLPAWSHPPATPSPTRQATPVHSEAHGPAPGYCITDRHSFNQSRSFSLHAPTTIAGGLQANIIAGLCG